MLDTAWQPAKNYRYSIKRSETAHRTLHLNAKSLPLPRGKSTYIAAQKIASSNPHIPSLSFCIASSLSPSHLIHMKNIFRAKSRKRSFRRARAPLPQKIKIPIRNSVKRSLQQREYVRFANRHKGICTHIRATGFLRQTSVSAKRI